MLGPFRSKRCEIRLAAMEKAEPVPARYVAAAGAPAAQALREIIGRDADEDAGAHALQIGQGAIGVLDGLEGDLQRQALLRIHRCHLSRRHVEEAGIEAEDVAGQEAAPARAHLARRVRVGVVEGVDVPAIRRDIDDAALLFQKKLPV